MRGPVPTPCPLRLVFVVSVRVDEVLDRVSRLRPQSGIRRVKSLPCYLLAERVLVYHEGPPTDLDPKVED